MKGKAILHTAAAGLLGIILALSMASLALATPGGAVTGDKTLAASHIRADGSTTVTLTLAGETAIEQHPVKVMLVLDHSLSMQGQKLVDIKAAANHFLDLIDESSDGALDGTISGGSGVGLVAFTDTLNAVQSPIGFTAPVKNLVNGLGAYGGTSIYLGIEAARVQLAAYAPTNRKILILMSDGGSNFTAAAYAADNAKAQGVTIYTIALGAVPPYTDYMRYYASDAAKYYLAPTSAQLDAAFQSIGATITQPAGTNISVVDTVDDHFTVSGESATKGAVGVSGNEVTWTISSLMSETATLTYTITHDPSKPGGLEFPNVSTTYSDDQGKTVTFPNPSLLVNTPPVLGVDSPGVTVDEGAQAVNTGTWSDADGDAVALSASSGAVTPNENGTWSWNSDAKDGPAGPQTVTITATDDYGEAETASFALTVDNVAPSCGPITVPGTPVQLGASAAVTASFTDPGVLDTHTASWDWGDGSGSSAGVVTEADGDGSVAGSHTYAAGGLYTVNLTVTDKDDDSGTAEAAQQILVNAPPQLTVGADAVSVDEGSVAANGGTVEDLFGGAVTLNASIGAVANDGDGTWSWSYTPMDGEADSQTVTITAADGCGGTDSSTFALSVKNVAPKVGAISVPVAVVPIGTAVAVSAPFADPGTSDTHTAVWNWEGSSSEGVVTESGGSGSVKGSHVYSVVGVYTVALTVTDKDCGIGTSSYQYVVAYDPSAGFVTGGGWIMSPAGAYVPDPTLGGKASFGFVSKYLKGATLPTGNTEFVFHAASMNFQSGKYDWLVISGAKAQYKGVGRINGVGNFGFLLTAIDGQASGGGGADKLRLKIWDKDDDDAIVYDNTFGAADTADPTMTLGGGSIVIHK